MGKMWRSTIQDPAIFTVTSPQAILDRKRLARVEGISVNVETAVEVFPVNALGPAIAKLLLQAAAGKVEPTFVEEGAELVRARHPDQHRRSVGYRAKTRFTLTQLFLRYFALGDVARHPAREGGFATFV